MRNVLMLTLFFSGAVVSKESQTLEFGNPSESMTKLVYNLEGHQENVQLVFYIDKLPFVQEVNLCSDIPIYSNLKSVAKDHDGKIVNEVYEKSSNQCNSTFVLQKVLNDQIHFDVNLKSFSGFQKIEFAGHTNHIPRRASDLIAV